MNLQSGPMCQNLIWPARGPGNGSTSRKTVVNSTSTGLGLLFAAISLSAVDVHAAFQISPDAAVAGIPIVIQSDAAEQVQFAADQLEKTLRQIFNCPFPMQKNDPPATGTLDIWLAGFRK